MSFRVFVYYCALCGGWAAFLAWAAVQGTGVRSAWPPLPRAALTAGLLGLLVAGGVGLADALLHASGRERLARVGVCMGLGLLGGLVGGCLGQGLNLLLLRRPAVDASRALSLLAGVGTTLLGWVVCGVLIGASVAAYDVARALATGQGLRAPLKKASHGALGGFVGGFLGGLPFAFLQNTTALPRSDLTLGLVTLGVCIGLMIGLAQVVLREAWVTVESGFRAGRELILSKDETTVGRAEGCDLGLFGDNAVERLHARILRLDSRYLLADAGTSGGTFLNGQLVDRPTPLRSGDAIRVGKSVLRFGERQKRAD